MTVFLDKRSELLSSFMEASSEIGRKLIGRNICKPSKESVKTYKDYVVGREIKTMLKIAVDIAAFTFAV